jgi:site-specific DNA recombinase
MLKKYINRLKKINETIMNKFTPAFVYTRVSIKEGTNSKPNIETQKKYCDKYAKQNIITRFGGRFDSIKTDGYKEFCRMLSFARKQNLSYIIVYSPDRIFRICV